MRLLRDECIGDRSLRTPLAVTKPDPQQGDRWITLGAAKEQLLVVVHSDAEGKTDEGQDYTRIRIISARRATPRERRAYRDEP